MTEEEFSRSVAALRDKMYAKAYPILQNRADAEDAVGSATLLAFEHRTQLTDPEKLEPWVLTITRNEALKMRQKQMLLPGNEAVEALLGGWRDSYSELWDVIQGLPKEQRDTVVLFYYNDLSLREIAEILDVREGTVKSRLNRARSEIRRQLSPKPQYRRLPKRAVRTLLVAVIAGALLFGVILPAAAHWNLFDFFRLRLNDFFGGSPEEEVTVQTEETSEVSRPSLQLELKERMVNQDNVYLLLLLSMPPEIPVSEDCGFSYYAFYDGEDISSDHLIGGAVNCRLFEIDPEVPNAATFVITLNADMTALTSEYLTLYLEDFCVHPYQDNEEVLIPGAWSLSFSSAFTETDEIVLPLSLTIPFLDGEATAVVKELTVTPLGMTVLTDITDAPQDLVYVSDHSISVTLCRTDGTFAYVFPYDDSLPMILDSGGTEFSEDGDAVYQEDIYQFTGAQDLSAFSGAYIQGIYVPFYGE